MTNPSIALYAFALLMTGAGCFEVPPLPNDPGCAGGEACEANEVCRDDGFCAPDDLVFIELLCIGEAGTVLSYSCDGNQGAFTCTGEGFDTVIECTAGKEVRICCGAARACMANPPRFDRTSVVLRPTPDTDWDCEAGPENADAQYCVHPGFSPSPMDVAYIECDTGDNEPDAPELPVER